jgi:hypothetical protein
MNIRRSFHFMKKYPKLRAHYKLPVKTILVVVVIASVVEICTTAFSNKDKEKTEKPRASVVTNDFVKDSIESVKAFNDVYKVLMSPRCMNCHPAGDIPLQGDDSHPHTMSPRRGEDGRGVYAMRCANCHQPTNSPGLHTPPGSPKWQLPPANMKMVFQGRTAHELALQIMDYNQNGNKNKEQLIEHARDTLVKAAWNMGEGRTLPPMSYEEFVKAWDDWINKGGHAPAR